MKLAEAQGIAAALSMEMQPFCEQCEIAGSVRRLKEEVKDIELVVVPKWEEGQVEDLFSGKREKTNLLYRYLWNHPIIKWIKPGTPDIVPWRIDTDGKYWRGLIDGKIKLDLFLTTPDQFGLIFLIRTGPAEFSHRFVMKQYQGGLLPNDYRVEDGHLKLVTGQIMPTPDEETVFRLAGMEYIEPEDRQ